MLSGASERVFLEDSVRLVIGLSQYTQRFLVNGSRHFLKPTGGIRTGRCIHHASCMVHAACVLHICILQHWDDVAACVAAACCMRTTGGTYHKHAHCHWWFEQSSGICCIDAHTCQAKRGSTTCVVHAACVLPICILQHWDDAATCMVAAA